MIIRKPLSEAQKEILAQKDLPSAAQIQKSQDELFLYLVLKTSELEKKINEKILSLRQSKPAKIK